MTSRGIRLPTSAAGRIPAKRPTIADKYIASADVGQILDAMKNARPANPAPVRMLAIFERNVVSFLPPHSGQSIAYGLPTNSPSGIGTFLLQCAQVAKTVFNAV